MKMLNNCLLPFVLILLLILSIPNFWENTSFGGKVYEVKISVALIIPKYLGPHIL